MTKLIFYRQLRMDGGIRTGVEVDGETVYGLFEEGESDDDPRLRWFIDLRCLGPKLPRSGRGARKWLLEHGPELVAGIEHCSREIRAGIDPEVYSISWDGFENQPPEVALKLVVSAARRGDAIAMPDVLRALGSNWERIIRALKPPVETARP